MAMAVILRHPVHRDHVPRRRASTSCRSSSPSRRSSPRSRTTSTATRCSFYLFQAFTALLLFLAANTSFAAFPRLAAVLAEDGFIPRQFAFRGDRLAFSTGIMLLGLIAALVVVAGGGSHPRPDPAVRGGRVHRLHDQPVGHGPALAARPRTRAGATGSRSTRRARCSTGGDRGRRHVGQVRRRRVARDRARSRPSSAIMLFIRRQYDGQASELAVRDDLVFERPHREQRVVVPVNGHQPRRWSRR